MGAAVLLLQGRRQRVAKPPDFDVDEDRPCERYTWARDIDFETVWWNDSYGNGTSLNVHNPIAPEADPQAQRECAC